MSYHSAQSSMSSSHSIFEPTLSSTFPMSHFASRTRLPFQSFPQPTTSSAASLAPTNVVAAPATSSSLVGASGYPSTSLQFVERYAPYSAGPGPMDNNNGSRAMPYIAPTSFNPYRPNEVKHRKRTSRVQLKILEETFRTQTDKPDAALRQSLSQRLNMPPRNVQIWFQNRRAKEKKLRAADGTTSASEANSAATTLSESTPGAASPLSVSVSPTEVPSSENSAVQADGLNHVLSQFSHQSSSSSFMPSEFAPYKFDGLSQHRGSVPHIRTGLPTESLHQRSASSPTSLNSLNVPRPLTVQPVVQTPRSLTQSSTYVFPPSMYQNPTTQPQLGEAFTFNASAQLTEESRFLDATPQDGVGQVPFLADQGRTSSTDSSQTVQAVGGGSANVLTAYHQSPPLHDLSPYSGTFSNSASPPSGLSSSSQIDLVNEYSYGYDTKYTLNGASKDSPAPFQPQGYDFTAINNTENDMLAYRTYMLQHSDAPNYGMTGPAVTVSNELQLGLESGLDMEYLYNTHSGRHMGYGAKTYNSALGAF